MLGLAVVTGQLGHAHVEAMELKYTGGRKDTKLLERLQRNANKPARSKKGYPNRYRPKLKEKRDSQIGKCSMRAAKARLGGKKGILITSIDQDQRKINAFCIKKAYQAA
jgi:hypothetical protein